VERDGPATREPYLQATSQRGDVGILLRYWAGTRTLKLAPVYAGGDGRKGMRDRTRGGIQLQRSSGATALFVMAITSPVRPSTLNMGHGAMYPLAAT